MSFLLLGLLCVVHTMAHAQEKAGSEEEEKAGSAEGAATAKPEPASAKPESAPTDTEKGSKAVESPSSLIERSVVRLRTILGEPEGAKKEKDLRSLAADLIDYRELGRRALGRQWDERSEAEQDEYVGLLQSLIEASYLREASRDPNFNVEIEEEELRNEGQIGRVMTLAISNKTEIEMEYRLMRRTEGKGDWIAYDISVDGVSMVANYRKSFGDIIRRDGFPRLLSRMRDRLSELEKD